MGSQVVRGAVVHAGRASQLRDFTGLRFGNITPTDIDGVIEYKNKCYVFFEAKVGGVEMPIGQQLALERLCDDLQRIKPTLLIVFTNHNKPSEMIDFANSVVEKYRHKGKWHSIGNRNVRCVVEAFIAKTCPEPTQALASAMN